MKRVTIALDEELYVSLVDYAANKSKREMRRFSIGEAIRELLALQLASLGYLAKDHSRYFTEGR